MQINWPHLHLMQKKNHKYSQLYTQPPQSDLTGETRAQSNMQEDSLVSPKDIESKEQQEPSTAAFPTHMRRTYDY